MSFVGRSNVETTDGSFNCSPPIVVYRPNQPEISDKPDKHLHGVNDEEWLFINNGENFKCVEAHYQDVHFPMCLYTAEEDIHISRAVLGSNSGMFELNDLTYFMDMMSPDMGLIDIGTNLGTYTLPAAHLGHQVLAVEMMPRTITRLKTSIVKGHITSKVKLIQAAVANKRTHYWIGYDETNRGDSFVLNSTECKKMKGKAGFTCDPDLRIPTIVLDDLVDLVTFNVAAMKVDVQGAELYAFQRATELFDKVRIQFVLLEWVLFAEQLQNSETPPSTVTLINQLAGFFHLRNYTVYDPDDKNLSNVPLEKWPPNVIFKARDWY